jgi:ABC-2 type transport system ATP-binding protein
MTSPVIETAGLTVYYGKHRGIEKLDLQVEKGEVFGFLGPNGAGKTTTIRVLLDIIRPTKGSARDFGLDCQTDSVEVRRHVGYLQGELHLPENMRGRQYLDMLNALRGGNGDRAYRDELCRRLDLDTSRRVQNYSTGNKQKLGIVAAFMNKPDLLILDEPTSGLDPLMQQTVLQLVRETQGEGRTVFFSSHILPEVQAVANRVGIIREGSLVAVERVDTLIAQNFRRIRFEFEQSPPEDAFALDGVVILSQMNSSVLLEVFDNMNQVMQTAVQYGIYDVETQPVTLEEVFLAYYGKE